MQILSYDYADEEKDTKQKAERLSAINDILQILMFNYEGIVAQYYMPNIEEVMDMIVKNILNHFQIQIEEIYLKLA